VNKQTIIDALKGVAIGDAFGVGIEFKSRFWITQNVDFTKFVNVWKGGVNNIHPGTYSDDTEALLSDEQFSEELLLTKFKNEYENDKRAKGYPRDGHGSIEDWYNGKKTIEEVRLAQANREDPGNAPVMRSVPLVFIRRDDLLNYSRINANSTHPHKVAVKATYLTALAGWHFLRNGGAANELIPFLFSSFDDDVEMQKLLMAIDVLPAPNNLSEDDYFLLHGEQPLPYIPWDHNIFGLPCACMKTGCNAVYILKHSTSAFDALKKSIRMGGDIDSLAAVCTGIAGGYYGLDSLPSFLLEKTEGLSRMQYLGEKLFPKFFSS